MTRYGLGSELLDAMGPKAPPPPLPPPQLPKGAIVRRSGSHLEMQIPSAGFRQRGLSCVVIGGGMLAAAIFVLCGVLLQRHDPSNRFHPALLGVPWSLGFGAVGLFTLYRGLQLGAQRLSIIAGPDGLRIERQIGWRRRQFAWRREDLKRIRLGRTNFGDPRQEPMSQLEIVPQHRKAVAFMHGRTVAEIRFVAESIDAAMGIAAGPKE